MRQPIRSIKPPHRSARTRYLWLACWSIGGIIVYAHTALLTLILLPLASGIFVYLFAKRISTDAFLPRVVLVSFGLGIMVSTLLYGVACLSEPRIAGMVVKPGFWRFAGDAAFYHQIGTQIAVSLRHRIPFPGVDIGYGSSYYLIIGLLYWLLGSHPMIIAMFNVMLLGVTVVLVFGMTETISHVGSARFAALATALWPSAFLWSSQLLKDIPTVFLAVAALYCGIQLIDARDEQRHPLAELVGAVGLFLSLFLLFFLRGYLAIALMTAVDVAVIVRWIRRLLVKGEIVRSGVALVLMASAIFSAYYVRSGFLMMVFNPRPKSVSSFSAGVEYEQAGRWDLALEAYREAIVLQEDFAPAYLNLGLLLARQGKWLGGRRMLSRFLELYPTDFSAESIRNVVALLDQQAQTRGLPIAKAATSTPALESWRQDLEKTIASFNRLTGRWLIPDHPGEPHPRREERSPETQSEGSSPATLPTQADPGFPVSLGGIPTPASENRQEAATSTPALESWRQDLEKTIASFNRLTGRWLIPERLHEPDPALVNHFLARGMSPKAIATLRQGFIRTGGDSLLTTELSEQTDVLQFIKWTPAAVAAVLFSPYPWNWFDRDGHVLIYRLLAGLESLVVLVLFPAICWGGIKMIRSRRPAGTAIVVFFFLLAIGIGVPVVNAGTLFRLRLPVAILLLMMAGVGVGSRPWFGMRFFADPNQTDT